MLDKRGHITMAILVLLLGVLTMMFILFKSGKSDNPHDIAEELLRSQSTPKESPSKELVKKVSKSEDAKVERQSKEETNPAKEDNKIGIENQPKKLLKKPLEQMINGSTRKKTEISKRSVTSNLIKKSSPIDVFVKSPPIDRRLKEGEETREGNLSEKASQTEENLTIVSKKNIEEIQRKCWAALEFLKD